MVKLTIERDVAAALIGRVHGVVLGRTTVPILETVLLEATAEAGGRLTLVATDQAMEAIGHAPAAVETPGAVAVPANRLNDVLRNLPAGGEVLMQLDAHRLIVKCGRSRFVLPTLPASDFPSFSRGGMNHQADVPAKDLLRLLGKVAFAICKEQTRYYITGANLHAVVVDGARRLRLAATNGAALAYAEAPCPDDWADAPGFTVPEKAVGELQRLLDGLAGEVTIGFSGSLFNVEAETWSFATKLIDAQFPDYTRVIPADSPNLAVLDVESLARALKRCALMASDKVQSLKLSLSTDGLVIRSRDGSGGEAEDPVDGTYEGDAMELGFSARQLLPIVGAVAGETVEIRFGGPRDPAKFRDSADGEALFICMPLSV